MSRGDFPSVSVVTLNWNGRAHLGPCYRSLCELDYPEDKLELVLVDNGSRDGSVAFIRQHFPGVKVIRNDANLGFCKANNLGARAAQGEYVAFLNNDTRVDPAWLRELTAAVEADPEVVCVGSRILTWEGDGLDFAGGNVNFHADGFQPGYGSAATDPFPEVREILFACGGSMLVDREVFLGCGGFDEDFFAYLEDVDLGWRLWLLGYKVVLAPAAITYHHLRGTSRRLPREKIVTLVQRNALLSVMKNYSDENLGRVLPAALLLMVERAFLASGADAQRYRLDGASPVVGHLSEAFEPSDSGDGRSRGLRERVRQDGLWTTTRRAIRKGWRVLCRWLIWRLNRELEAVPRTSISYLVAADDVVRLLPGVMEKRAAIQQRRRRSDGEVGRLFGDPFRPADRSVLYGQAQYRLVRFFGIRSIFDDVYDTWSDNP